MKPDTTRKKPTSRNGGTSQNIPTTFYIGAVLFVATWLAYSNTLHAPFEFDDHAAIVDNASLRDFWAFHWLYPTAGGGSTASGRPVLAFTLAANFAFGGLNPLGYHIFNITLHALAALVLFAVVRRTLVRIHSTKSSAPVLIIAAAASPFWALHPIQTESVTYIVQRAESLMGFFYLLTFYFFLRGLDSARRVYWWAGSVLACLAGMGTKEVMVSAPVMLLLFDRAYIENSFSKIWRDRRGLYLALAATWLPLIYLVISLGGDRGGSTGGLGAQAAAVPYWLTQLVAISTYIKLIIWPSPLVFEYGPDVYHGVSPLIWGGIITTLLIGISVALWFRRPRVGFLGLFFLAILAPTSLVPGTLQAIVEHRLYLAIAPIAVLLVVVLYKFLKYYSLFLIVPLIATLGFATYQRNETYRSSVTLWKDTATKRPINSRAHHNYAEALAQAGNSSEAMAEYYKAIQIQPNHAFAHEGLGRLLLAAGNFTEATTHFRAALAADPSLIVARVDLARALASEGKTRDAIREYQAVLATEPNAADAKVNLGALLVAEGDVNGGIHLLRSALESQPSLPEAHYHLGLALEKSGDLPGAESAHRRAIEFKADLAPAHVALGNLLARKGDANAAATSYQTAIQIDPRSADAWYGLGNLHARAQSFDRAIKDFITALNIAPSLIEARNNLANCQLVLGDFQGAIANYHEVLRARPNDATVRENLSVAEEMLRQSPSDPSRSSR